RAPEEDSTRGRRGRVLVVLPRRLGETTEDCGDQLRQLRRAEHLARRSQYLGNHRSTCEAPPACRQVAEQEQTKQLPAQVLAQQVRVPPVTVAGPADEQGEGPFRRKALTRLLHRDAAACAGQHVLGGGLLPPHRP